MRASSSTGKMFLWKLPFPYSRMDDTFVVMMQQWGHHIGIDVRVAVDNAYFGKRVQVGYVENRLGRMFLERSLVIEYFSVKDIAQCTGVGCLESLYVDRIHLYCAFGSENQSVHGYQHTFADRFFGSGSDYGVVEVQRAIGTQRGRRAHGSYKYHGFVTFTVRFRK